MVLHVKFKGVAEGLTSSPVLSEFNSSEKVGSKGSIEVFEYQLIEAATDKFGDSNVLGGGGRGHVYRAQFSDKFFGAVKQLDDSGPDVEKEFEVALFFTLLFPGTYLSV